MKRLTLIASAAALGLGGAAMADHHGQQDEEMSGQDHEMTGQEQNMSGHHENMAERHEAMAEHHQNMSEHHENMEGHHNMSKDDMAFDMMFDSRLEQAFSAIDADENGNLSRQEWGEWQADDGFYAERFDDFDRDGDEVVSWEEYRSAARAMYDVSGM